MLEKIRLGRTGLMVTRCSFGVLPIQRTPMEEAAKILRNAYEAGINFFDTARGYTDSEEKLGYALADVRENIIIATKVSGAQGPEDVRKLLETSLKNLRTDYVDILQFHNPDKVPVKDEMYDMMVQLKKEGKIRFIGMTNHSFDNAVAAVESGLYDTIQFPLSYLSTDRDLGLIGKAMEKDVGVIAMKGLCGGLITNARVAWAFLRQYENVVPIWGIQHPHELEEFLGLENEKPALSSEMLTLIDKDKAELAGNFCRACGYCLPCPAEIPIPMAARMEFCLRRMPYEQFMTQEWQEKMRTIENCIHCGHCVNNCPYGLDTPALLKHMLQDYEEFLADYNNNHC